MKKVHGKIEGKKHEQIKQMIILDSIFHFSLNHGWYKSGERGVLCFGSQNFRLLTVQRQQLPMKTTSLTVTILQRATQIYRA